jgi:branched-chain amino acid transport system ATP-binding protein
MTARLEVQELTVNYGGLTALDGVSFSITAGQVFGLIGPNGAGKTTCIDAITGFTAATRGRVLLDGTPIERAAPHERARQGLVRTFQSVELFDDLTVSENLEVAANTVRWWSPFVDAVRPRRSRPDVRWALEAVGLDDAAGASPTDLSHGQRRLVGVARALVSRPRVVLLDEPAAGLDPAETTALAEVIAKIPEYGASVLLVDHDMSLVLGVCSKIAVIDFGRMIALGTPTDIRGDVTVITAYLGGNTE